MIKQYVKKPVVVEAVQWTGSNFDEIKEFCGNDVVENTGTKYSYLQIHTLEGGMTASKGDYIIKGVSGEFYPCKPDIFEKTYEVYTGAFMECKV